MPHLPLLAKPQSIHARDRRVGSAPPNRGTLRVGDLKGAARLQKKYKSDYDATFHWGLVLQNLMAGDEAAARKALEKARKVNRHR